MNGGSRQNVNGFTSAPRPHAGARLHAARILPDSYFAECPRRWSLVCGAGGAVAPVDLPMIAALEANGGSLAHDLTITFDEREEFARGAVAARVVARVAGRAQAGQRRARVRLDLTQRVDALAQVQGAAVGADGRVETGAAGPTHIGAARIGVVADFRCGSSTHGSSRFAVRPGTQAPQPAAEKAGVGAVKRLLGRVVSEARSKVAKRSPSKRASPSEVAIQRYPSGVNASAETPSTGRPSAAVQRANDHPGATTGPPARARSGPNIASSVGSSRADRRSTGRTLRR